MKVYGRNVIKELLRSEKIKLIKNIYISKDAEGAINQIKEEIKDKGLNFSEIPVQTMDNVLGLHIRHQGIYADMDKFEYYPEEKFAAEYEGKDSGFLIALDQVNDPQNFGAIIRSAYGAGADGIVITKDNSAQVNPTVIKVSTGLAFNLPIIKTVNLARFLDKIKSSGFWIYSADMDGESYETVEWDKKTALVFGNEGKGLRRLVKEKCDHTVRIPMQRDMDSLNLSVSVGIISFAVALKRS